ncbi:MAG: hypothetical protein ABSF70_05185 [Terracidiphilus sp.]|jgi:hypothetical protein
MKHRKLYFVFLLLSVSVLMYSFYRLIRGPLPNFHPKDTVEIIGAISDNVNAQVVARWQTTSASLFCQQLVSEAGFSQVSKEVPLQTTAFNNGQISWTLTRDQFQPGYCKWRLTDVGVYADARGFSDRFKREFRMANSIAQVVPPNAPFIKNSLEINDDVSKPVDIYCDFTSEQSKKRRADSSSFCDFMSKAAFGVVRDKSSHLLRPDQHTVYFQIFDLESHLPHP